MQTCDPCQASENSDGRDGEGMELESNVASVRWFTATVERDITHRTQSNPETERASGGSGGRSGGSTAHGFSEENTRDPKMALGANRSVLGRGVGVGGQCEGKVPCCPQSRFQAVRGYLRGFGRNQGNPRLPRNMVGLEKFEGVRWDGCRGMPRAGGEASPACRIAAHSRAVATHRPPAPIARGLGGGAHGASSTQAGSRTRFWGFEGIMRVFERGSEYSVPCNEASILKCTHDFIQLAIINFKLQFVESVSPEGCFVHKIITHKIYKLINLITKIIPNGNRLTPDFYLMMLPD